MSNVFDTLQQNYAREKARLKGEARSHVRQVKAAIDIPGVAEHLDNIGAAQPIEKAIVRMHDGKPMVFYSDGSLRHALGKRLTKAARKELKRARRSKNA